MELGVKTPEEWLQYIAKERTSYSGSNKYKHWMKLYRLAADSIPADELAHNNYAYAKIMVDFAKLQARTSEDDARAIFQAARSNVKHCSLIYVTWAQFELQNGNPKKCKKILEKGKQFCAIPAKLLNMALENFKSGDSQLIDEQTEEHTFTELINMSLCRADDHVKAKQRTSDSSSESTSSSLGALSPESVQTTESSEESGELLLSRNGNPPTSTNLTAIDELQCMSLNKNVEEKLKGASSVAFQGTTIFQQNESKPLSLTNILNESQLNLAPAAKPGVEIVKTISGQHNHTTMKPPSNASGLHIPTLNSTENEFKISEIKSSSGTVSPLDLANRSFAEQKFKAVDITSIKPPGVENPLHTAAQPSFEVKRKTPDLTAVECTSTAVGPSHIKPQNSVSDQQFKVPDLRASNKRSLHPTTKNFTEHEECLVPGLTTTTAKHTSDDVTKFHPTLQNTIGQKFLDIKCSVGINYLTTTSSETRKEQRMEPGMFTGTELKRHSLGGSDSSDDYDPLSFKKSLLNIGNKTGLMDFATPQNKKSSQNGASRSKDEVIPTNSMVKKCQPNRKTKRSVFVSLPQRVPKSASDTNIYSIDGVYPFPKGSKTNEVQNTCDSEGQSKVFNSLSKHDLYEDKLAKLSLSSKHIVDSEKEKVFSEIEYSLNSKPDLLEEKSIKSPSSTKHNVENVFSDLDSNLKSNSSNLHKKLSTKPPISNQHLLDSNKNVNKEIDYTMDSKPSDLLIKLSCEENALSEFDCISKSEPNNSYQKMSTKLHPSHVKYNCGKNVFCEMNCILTSKAHDVKSQSMQVSSPLGHYDADNNTKNIFAVDSKLPSDLPTLAIKKSIDQQSNDYLSDTPMVHPTDSKNFKHGCGISMPLSNAAMYEVKSIPIAVDSQYQHPNNIEQGCIPGPVAPAFIAMKGAKSKDNELKNPLVPTTSIQSSKIRLGQAGSVVPLGNVDYAEQAAKTPTLDYITTTKPDSQKAVIQQSSSQSQVAPIRKVDPEQGSEISTMDLMTSSTSSKKTPENDTTNTAISSFKPVTHSTPSTRNVLQAKTSAQSVFPIEDISIGSYVASCQESIQESSSETQSVHSKNNSSNSSKRIFTSLVSSKISTNSRTPSLRNSQLNCSASGLRSGFTKDIFRVSGPITGTIPVITVNGKAYSKLNMIGRGGSSEVYTVLDCNYNQYALKYVDLTHADATVVESYVNEITLLKRLQGHESIIKLYDWEMDNANKAIKIVLERGSTDLAGYLKKNPDKITIDFIKMCWKKMLDAVDVVHKAGIIHTDLKPANFLLVEWNLKLIDFGIANAIQGDVTSFYRDSTIGTLSYMSPEALKDVSQSFDQDNQRKPMMKIGRPSDVWSLGCILFLMVYKKTPFQDIRNNFQKWRCIIDPSYEIKFPWIENQDLLDCMKGCLRRNPSERYTIAQLQCHPFLTGRASANDVDNVLNCLMQMQDIRSPRTLRSFAQNLVGHLSSGSSLNLASVKPGESSKGSLKSRTQEILCEKENLP